MVFQAFGERERLSDESRTTLSQGAPEPFDVVGQAITLACWKMLTGRDHVPIRLEEVGAAQGVVADVFGQRLPQALGREVGSIPDDHRQDTSGLRIEYGPDPVDLLLRSHETPHFVGFDHYLDFFFGGNLGRSGWRIQLPQGVVAVEFVDEVLEPASGDRDGSGDGPQGHPFPEQAKDECLLLLGDERVPGMFDELPVAAPAEELRRARIVRTVANHMRGGTVWTGWMDTSR